MRPALNDRRPPTRRRRTGARALLLLLIAGATGAIGCAAEPNHVPDADAGVDATTPDGATGPDADADPPLDASTTPQPCPADATGLDCLVTLYDRTRTRCEPAAVAAFTTSLTTREGELPVWHAGRALFVTYDTSAAVAGAWNGWDDTALFTERVCTSNVFVADTPLASGRYPYKLVRAGQWQLDPLNWAFAFDDFAGNADGKNSVINTYDSGLGHLVQPSTLLCSTALGNCRTFTTYLPAGYAAPMNAARAYPVVFMHDGQNLWDDTDCCLGHTGWEVNVTLDAEIAAGRVEPLVIVGFDHAGAGRTDEYGYPIALGGMQETFMAFQVTEVQPTAAAYWRLDPARYYTAGSSLGGLVSLALGLYYPAVYAGIASFSGSYFLGEGTGEALVEQIPGIGKVGVAIYLDHGGSAAVGNDNYAVNIALRDQLQGLGWQLRTSDNCTPPGDDVLCYHHEAGATHDELAWRERNWRAWRFLLAGP